MWGDQKLIGVVVVLAAGALIGSFLGMVSSVRSPGPDVGGSAGMLARPEMIRVHVAGWVNAPGVVSIPAGSIAAAAIEAAGGLRAGARSDSINLAASLAAGDQLVVPGPGAAAGGNADDGLIGVNSASVSELERLPGVGPVLASRIVEFREANGPFSEMEDLLDVAGIGEAKLSALRDLLKLR